MSHSEPEKTTVVVFAISTVKYHISFTYSLFFSKCSVSTHKFAYKHTGVIRKMYVKHTHMQGIVKSD